MRFGFVGSIRIASSNPRPPMPLMIGCPKVGVAVVAAGTSGHGRAKLKTARPAAPRHKTNPRRLRGWSSPDSAADFFNIAARSPRPIQLHHATKYLSGLTRVERGLSTGGTRRRVQLFEFKSDGLRLPLPG